jgi:hypothetical protein
MAWNADGKQTVNSDGTSFATPQFLTSLPRSADTGVSRFICAHEGMLSLFDPGAVPMQPTGTECAPNPLRKGLRLV